MNLHILLVEHLQKTKKEIGDSRYIYENELDKAFFQHDMAYWDFKDLTRRTASDIILHEKANNFGENSKYDGYQRRLAWMVYKFFNKKSYATRALLETITTQAISHKLVDSGIKN